MRVFNGLLLILGVIAFVKANYDWTNAEHIIEQAINDRIFTGCVLGIATNNATLFKKAYGTLGPKYGIYAAPVTVDMKFDLGYLTEPIGINSALMELYDQSKLNTTTRASTLFFDFDNNGKRYITLQNLLEHNSGNCLSIKDFKPHGIHLSLKPRQTFLKASILLNLTIQLRLNSCLANLDQ